MSTGKTVALTIWTFVSKVMFLLFTVLSRVAKALLPRSKCLLISWLQSLSAVVLKPKEITFVIASTFSPVCHEVMRPSVMIFVFGMLHFNWCYSLYSFTLMKRLLSLSSLFAIRVISCTYLRLLIFLQAIIIPVCDSSIPAFHMMYSAYKLNKQGDNT